MSASWWRGEVIDLRSRDERTPGSEAEDALRKAARDEAEMMFAVGPLVSDASDALTRVSLEAGHEEGDWILSN